MAASCRLSRRQGHPWPLPAVFCAASCRVPVSVTGAIPEEPAAT